MDITLDDLFACVTQGTLLVAEDRDTGQPVHIDVALNGKRCNCICPCCRRELVARHGEMKRHSFAHLSQDEHASCSSAGETLLHRFAKEVLAASLYLYRPAVIVEDVYGPILVADEQIIAFDSVELEVRHGDVVPDVVCVKDGKRLFVEFKVTHAVDATKRQKLRRQDVAVLEVDLSSYRDVPIRLLAPIILKDAPRKFIQSRLLDQGRDMLASRSQERRRTLLQELKRLVTVWRRLPGKVDLADTDWFQECKRYRLRDQVPYEQYPGTSFNVDQEVWGLWIVWTMLSRSAVGSASVWVTRLKANGWLKNDQMLSLSDGKLDLLRTHLAPDFKTPVEEIKAFFKVLDQKETVVFEPTGVYRATRSLAIWYERRKAEVDIPEQRLMRIIEETDKLFELVPADLKDDFDLQHWLNGWCAHRSSNVAGLLHGDGILFDTITTGLERLRRLIARRSDIDVIDLEGLPLGRFIERYRLLREAEKEQTRMAAEAELERQAALRAEAISRDARSHLGTDAENWLSRELSISGVLALPHVHSSQSPALHSEVMSELRREVARHRDAEEFAHRKSHWGHNLRVEAARVFGRQDAADLWINSVNRDLGMKRPEEVCVDEKSFDLCVQLLPVNKRRKR